jgi:hypothetical protein
VGAVHFHQQKYAQLYYYAQLEKMLNYYARSLLYSVRRLDQRKPTGTKVARRMVIKLSPGVNFTNILLAQLRQYSCANKKFNLHCKHKKASRETFVRKMRA